MQLKKLRFNNMFSYGRDNEIDFLANKVTLIEGKIGAGKSSIPSILEEILYNKNSRGFKKTDILNRECGEKFYSGEVEFSVGVDEYVISKEVKTSARVTLLKNGVDISGHTATVTYKLLEDIIGLDFTNFSKLVYQSIISQMDFLSATDAKRKEFLVGLMDLGVYGDIESLLKEDKKLLDTELAQLDGSIKILESRISNKKETLLELRNDIEFDFDGTRELVDKLKVDIQEIDFRNSTINTDVAKYQNELSQVKTRISSSLNYIEKHNSKILHTEQSLIDTKNQNLPQPLPLDSSELQKVTRDLVNVQTLMSEAKKRYELFRADANKTVCHVCNSSLNKEEARAAALVARDEYNELKPRAAELEARQLELKQLVGDWDKYHRWLSDIDGYSKILKQLKTDDKIIDIEKQLISDNEILEKLLANPITKELISDNQNLKAILYDTEAVLKAAEKQQREVELHNASVEPTNRAILEKREREEEAKLELDGLAQKQQSIFEEINDLVLLQKSIKELVSYRIENEIKAFEGYINDYLTELSSGKFVLSFELTEAKLIVKIYNNGIETSISTLSSGETALVNLSTLFAIRKVMLATNDLNLVFLDEVISFLGDSDKDTLVNLLLEQGFNTMLVSHGYDNPLCKKIIIEKDSNEISRIWQ